MVKVVAKEVKTTYSQNESNCSLCRWNVYLFFFLHCREVQTTTVKPNNPSGYAEQTQAERGTHVACANHSGAKLTSSRSLLGLKKPDWLFVLEARAHAQEEGGRSDASLRRPG